MEDLGPQIFEKKGELLEMPLADNLIFILLLLIFFIDSIICSPLLVLLSSYHQKKLCLKL